ncbi:MULTISPECIES: condensation protein [Streptomyces]|uniref:Condensation protein n=1 Tax=Streptomyces caniscabiei TaxID=2746961 RepID=A0ABU4MS02_9ACTN|nr:MULTISPECIES: condensation protein [Streptomyces]MBE4737866.1 condensation protein [Streptomyces caniscabiei]MBE4757335.1 condensation protein [Streptomyces caniscabiei]MBE4769334.1 condensation protein [Streptomyces caniscabiei]MBE4784945.1 condensation protein [Streptomyces caniscabiei]MBE4795729.1 condensation protein [Streptomyces caniscabiei]
MTALDRPARDDAAPGPVRIPFPVVDEVSRHCHQEKEPETVHIEVHLPGRLDPDRLRTAFTAALRHHPRILMREAPGHWYRRRYEWELTEEPEVEVVTFLPAGPHALRDARTRALMEAPPLTLSPPIRLEVVEGAGPAVGSEASDAVGLTAPHHTPPHPTPAASHTPTPPKNPGTVLFLTINHTALDGPACLRILATAAQLYGGQDNAPTAPPVRPTPTQDAPPPAETAPPSNWARPARVAPGTPEPSPGNGLLVTELPVPRRPKSAPYTVNDQLMVTTALMLAHWNREHGARPRPLRITMPVDDRTRDTDMPIGNGTRLVEVPFSPEELRPDATPLAVLLRRTADRTRALKSLPRPQLGHGASLLTAPVVPVSWRAALTRGLRRAAAPWTSTTLLSNIGRVPYSLDFGEEAGRAHAVWFSAPARMPRGLTVTTASTAGRLHLALRWSRALLSHGDGAHLRDLFEHYLHATEEDIE